MSSGRVVDVWYVCDETLCNFKCPYCVTGPARSAAGHRAWAEPSSEQRFRTIIKWLARLPWRIRVRLGTVGEPFVSAEFLQGAAWLSRQSNVDLVELVTNGSFTDRQFRAWVLTCAMDRITLWTTYHPTQISAERIVAGAVLAQASGAFVIVHSLAFADNLDDIERLVALCKEHSIRTDITIGRNSNGAFPGAGVLPILDVAPQRLTSLYRDAAALQAAMLGLAGPKGEPCSAGHDYITVDPDGSIYQCGPYSLLKERRLGSALEHDFVPELRSQKYAPCRNGRPCWCKEDYFHLKIVREELRFSRSLGYYERCPGTTVHVGEHCV